MVTGVGTDILALHRFRRIMADDSQVFLDRVYTVKEQELARSRPDSFLFFATRFAGKEAVFKALGIPSDSFRLVDIEILSDPTGRPEVTLYGQAAELSVKQQLAPVHLSLSFEDEYVVAFAVIQTSTH